MTTQSVAWAIEQQLPGTAKLVLMALANSADHTNGYCHFDVSMVAHEASVQANSLWRYLGALERNGYVTRDDVKTANGERRDYWLCFDRDPALKWAWTATDTRDADDVDGSIGPEQGSSRPAPSRVSDVPTGFAKTQQDTARGELKPAESAAAVDRVPVLEGSKAFTEWCDTYRSRGLVPPFVHTIIVDGKERRGFYRPTLFPVRVESIEGAA